MKKLYFILILLIFLSCSKEKSTLVRDVLDRSIAYHDPQNIWKTNQCTLEIAEPRIKNSKRNSIVEFNPKSGKFLLIRNRAKGFSKHWVDSLGKGFVSYNDLEIIPDSMVKKYRLEPSRSLNYKKFYDLMYGLPMALKDETNFKITKTRDTTFYDHKVTMIQFSLQEKMIGDLWSVFFDTTNNSMRGLVIQDSEKSKDEGDIIVFDSEISVSSLRIPRFRHWYELNDSSYSGSDIIVNIFQKESSE